MLERKIERAMELAREQRQQEDGLQHKEPSDQNGDLPSMEELIAEERGKAEKGQMLPMLLSAYRVFLPACILAILLICLIAYAFMGGFR